MAPADDLPKRRLRVFLCHSSADKEPVRKLYEWLVRDEFDPWLDEKKLLPAQRWGDEIEDAVRASDVVLVCLSNGAVNKEGFLQREIKFALEIAEEKPDGTVYIVPTRLEPVELPRRFREYQAADLFAPDGYERLKQSLALRAAQIAVAPPSPKPGPHFLQHSGPAGRDAPTAERGLGFGWIRTYPRATILLLLMVLGASAFGAYRFYRNQKQQLATADQFYKEGLASWKALELRQAEDLLSLAAVANPKAPAILASYALSLNERGNELKAREISQKALDLAPRLSIASRRMVEAVHSEITADWKSAESLYMQLWQSSHDPEVGLRLAHVQTMGGSPAKALETIRQVEKFGDDDPRFLLEKANAQKSLGKYDDETITLDRIMRAHPNKDLVRATALADRCWADYNSRGVENYLKTALEDCSEAADIFNDKEDALGHARTLTRQALIVTDKESKNPNFPQGLDWQRRAIEVARERGAQRDEAGGRQNLANMLMEQPIPDPEGAGIEYDQSEEIFQRLEDRQGLAGLENDRAVRLMELCRFAEAFQSAKQAGENWHTVGSANESIALANQGAVQLYLGQLAGAEEDLRRALFLAEQAKLNVDNDNWLITLGEVFQAEGKLPLAEQCYKGGPCYDAEQPSTVHAASVLPDADVDYAALQIDLGQATEAGRLGEQAVAKAKEDKDPDNEAAAHIVVAQALLAGENAEAWSRARAEVESAKKLNSNDCRLAMSADLLLAEISGRSGDLASGREQLSRVLQKAHSLGLLEYVLRASLAQAQIDLRGGKADTALEVAGQVASQSHDRGFSLVAQKAADVASQAKLSLAREHTVSPAS
jgi:hypothetical protein